MASVAMLMLEAGQLIYTMASSLTPKPDVTRVNIIVGSSDTDDSLGGNAPYVTLYDNGGKFMGFHQPPDRKKVWGQGKTSKHINYGFSKELSASVAPSILKIPASPTLDWNII